MKFDEKGRRRTDGKVQSLIHAQHSARKSRLLSVTWWLATVIFIALATLFSASTCWGQVKYDPGHEEVEVMARTAVRFLESSETTLAGEELILAALTISEVSKRYDRVIPRDNPVIQRAVRTIQSYIAAGKDPETASPTGGMEKHLNLYYPALSAIVLLDIDDVTYREEIKYLLDLINRRRQPNGAYNYIHHSERDPTVGDISQTQYACLANFVAKHHGFKVDLDGLKGTLEWLMDEQTPEGSWYYHTRGQKPPRSIKSKAEKTLTLSRHCCGAGSTYLLADLLQLNPRMRNKSKGKGKVAGRGGLPPSVSVYVKPKDDGTVDQDKDGPLVNINGSKLAQAKRKADNWLDKNFSIETHEWNYYYLYGLERYAYFREAADGEVSEAPDWYDQGVEFLKEQQEEGGFFKRRQFGLENTNRSTCLATLFLVRSSEVLVLPNNASTLNGGLGFPEGMALKEKNGRIQSQAAVKNIEDVMNLLDEDATDEQLQLIADSMDDAIRSFSSDDTKSKAETLAFLTGLVKDRNYYKRLIAVKMLAREQTMDNVPALLYALGDPDKHVCQEAHDGLRLVSRKIDSFPVSDKPSLEEFKVLKRNWTKWFLEIRPGAELID